MAGVLNAPNAVSFLRLALVPVFVWLVFAREEYGWAGILLGVIGATDWIDGYLARRFDQITEFGKLLDPIADRVAVIVAVVAGLYVGVLPAWFAIALITRDVAVSIGAGYGWLNGVTKLEVRFLGKTATFILYVAIAAFYIGAGFSLDWLVWIAIIAGAPGLAMYFWVAVLYFNDMRTALTDRG